MKTRLTKTGAAAGAVAGAGALAIALIGNFEGLRLYAYQDVIGVWTACYGETKGIRPGMRFSKDQCDRMFIGSLVEHEAGMRACLDDPDSIPEKPYVAFLSLTYNIGTAGFCRSSVARRINDGDIVGACNALPAFNRAGGQVVRGLVARREKERQLCLEGAR